MINYGVTRSIEKPLEVDIKETKVFVASNIHQVTTTIEGEEITEYEFNYAEYPKDDYLLMLVENNSILEESLTDTQLALCEVYEMIGG